MKIINQDIGFSPNSMVSKSDVNSTATIRDDKKGTGSRNAGVLIRQVT